MKIVPNLIKDSKDEWLVQTIATINEVNPVIDRIMEDESVASVIFTNADGVPVLTNAALTNASNFGRGVHKLGMKACNIVKELDVLDEALVLRIVTKRYEVLMAPHPTFNIIIVQRSRVKNRKKLMAK